MLLKAILSGISDEKIVDSHVVIPTPLRDMIRNYNKIALHDQRMPMVTEETTGAQLKEAIGSLSADDQIALLYAYSEANKKHDASAVQSEDPILVEEKKLRVLLTKFFIACLAIFGCMLVGAVVAIAVSMGAFKNFWTNRLVMTASDIIKFIFFQ